MLFKKKKQIEPKSSIEHVDGKEVLARTEYFQLYVIRLIDSNEILGTVLLTKTQQKILNESCNNQGIRFASY